MSELSTAIKLKIMMMNKHTFRMKMKYLWRKILSMKNHAAEYVSQVISINNFCFSVALANVLGLFQLFTFSAWLSGFR